MIFGKLPFNARTLSELQAAQAKGCQLTMLAHAVSQPCLALLQSLLTLSPDERLTAEEILHHSWFSSSNQTTCISEPGAVQELFHSSQPSSSPESLSTDKAMSKSPGSFRVATVVSLCSAKQTEQSACRSGGAIDDQTKQHAHPGPSCNQLQSLVSNSASSCVEPFAHSLPSLRSCRRQQRDKMPGKLDSRLPDVNADGTCERSPRLPFLTDGIMSPRLRVLQPTTKETNCWSDLRGSGSASVLQCGGEPSLTNAAAYEAHSDISDAHLVELSGSRLRSKSCFVLPLGDLEQAEDEQAALSPMATSLSMRALTTGKRVIRRRRSRTRSATASPSTTGLFSF